MSSAIEQLPVSICDGRYYLRIKKREHGKNWCIRYLGKVENIEDVRRGWTYSTKIQVWGNRLEPAAEKMLRSLEKKGLLNEQRMPHNRKKK